MSTPLSLRRLAMPLLVAVIAPSVLPAQEVQVGTWVGRVDKEMLVTIRGGGASMRNIGGQALPGGRFRVTSPLPQQDGTVRIAVESGRGNVSIVQQPTAQNGYAAVLRIVDDADGADLYRVTTYWTPANVGYGNRRGGFGGRGRGRGAYANGPTMHWSGDVDGDVELRWRGANVTQRVLSGNMTRATNSSISGDVGQWQNQTGQVAVNMRQGRGRVEVVQQPNAGNRWTAIIRISDPQPGYGHYEIDALLQ